MQEQKSYKKKQKQNSKIFKPGPGMRTRFSEALEKMKSTLTTCVLQGLIASGSLHVCDGVSLN